MVGPTPRPSSGCTGGGCGIVGCASASSRCRREDRAPVGPPAHPVALRLLVLLGGGLPGLGEPAPDGVGVELLPVGQPLGVVRQRLRSHRAAVRAGHGEHLGGAGGRVDVDQHGAAVDQPLQPGAAAGGDLVVDVVPEDAGGQPDPHAPQVLARRVRVVGHRLVERVRVARVVAGEQPQQHARRRASAGPSDRSRPASATAAGRRTRRRGRRWRAGWTARRPPPGSAASRRCRCRSRPGPCGRRALRRSRRTTRRACARGPTGCGSGETPVP